VEKPTEYAKQLVDFLTAGETDPFQAIKNLHDWIALAVSYDYQAFVSNSIPSQDPWSVLSNRRAVCAGYALLFQRFCELAGFHCATVSGYSRGYGYDPLAVESIIENHAWNAVKIADAWYLLDVTWDSGHIFNGRFQRHYSTDYFLLPAVYMIYTHFPTMPSWQMLPIAVSTSQFTSMPCFEGRFFKYPFRMYTELQRTYSCDGELAIELEHEPGVLIQAALNDEKERTVPQAVFMQTIPTGTELRIRPQATGQWELLIFAGNRSSPSFDHVWTAGVTATAVTGQSFPEQFEPYRVYGCRLGSTLASPLQVGQIVDFDLTANTDEILVVAGSTRQTFSPDSAGRFIFSFEIPQTDKLEIFARHPIRRWYNGILQYRITK
jgi:hypothetical protein